MRVVGVACCVLVAVGLGACGGDARLRTVLRVNPRVGLADAQRSIVVSGLRPGAVVRISATTSWADGVWQAQASYRATADGVVDLSEVAPRSGSYHGVSTMGLFWSEHYMRAGLTPADAATTALTVSDSGRRLASASVVGLLSGRGVTEHTQTLARSGFVGRYFTPSGTGRHPAVVLWGGSEGGFGVTEQWAALLASHGIPALALAYFDEPGLPCSLSNIPLEYFAKAVRWLAAQPQVRSSRVWVLSGSRGSEAELLVADHWPHLVHGLVAEAPSSTVYGPFPGQCAPPKTSSAWTWHRHPIAYDQPLSGAITYNRDGSTSHVTAYTDALGLPAATAARIPVRAIHGPVMLISGSDDQLWPSRTFSDQIMAELPPGAGHVHLNYPAAGHIVFGIPYRPTLIEERAPRGVSNLGGSLEANNAAHEQDWPAAIKFIADH
jgi:BAAT / Acyl-CoA thioester hydrolase C terminal/Acyl-CoA thioester hydrolase/BAAT N-terminal region